MISCSFSGGIVYSFYGLWGVYGQRIVQPRRAKSDRKRLTRPPSVG